MVATVLTIPWLGLFLGREIIDRELDVFSFLESGLRFCLHEPVLSSRGRKASTRRFRTT